MHNDKMIAYPGNAAPKAFGAATSLGVSPSGPYDII